MWYGGRVANGEAQDDTNRGDKPGAASNGSLKGAIVRAAIELGTELGEEGLTMRGIAARLGVSATALYQHFEGKASILRAIRFHGLALMNMALAPAFDEAEPVDQLRRCALLYINFARSNPWLYGLLFEGDDVDFENLNEDEKNTLLLSQDSVGRAFQEGKDKGQLRADIDVQTGPTLMWAANHGVAMLLIRGRISEKHPSTPIPSETDFIQAFVEAEMRGLTPGVH